MFSVHNIIFFLSARGWLVYIRSWISSNNSACSLKSLCVLCARSRRQQHRFSGVWDSDSETDFASLHIAVDWAPARDSVRLQRNRKNLLGTQARRISDALVSLPTFILPKTCSGDNNNSFLKNFICSRNDIRQKNKQVHFTIKTQYSRTARLPV